MISWAIQSFGKYTKYKIKRESWWGRVDGKEKVGRKVRLHYYYLDLDAIMQRGKSEAAATD